MALYSLLNLIRDLVVCLAQVFKGVSQVAVKLRVFGLELNEQIVAIDAEVLVSNQRCQIQANTLPLVAHPHEVGHGVGHKLAPANAHFMPHAFHFRIDLLKQGLASNERHVFGCYRYTLPH